MRFRMVLFILFYLFTPLAQAESWDGSWVKTKEAEGVAIYEKKEAGNGLLAFGGDGLVEAPLLRVASVIFDSGRAKEWVDSLEECALVRWFSPTEYLEYDHIGTPFVMKDRDFLTRVKLSASPDGQELRFTYTTADSGELPGEMQARVKRSNYVRGDMSGSVFVLRSIEAGKKTSLHAEVHADPKGSVPKWIVNLFQRGWPLSTFEALRKEVAKADIQISPPIASLLTPRERQP